MTLKTGALCLAIVSSGVIVGTAGTALASPPPGPGRAYAAGKFALELDGIMAGWVVSVEGGNAAATVIEETGTQFYAKKHLANVRYRSIAIEFNPSSSDALLAWIKATLEGNHLRKSGAIVAVDYQGRIVSRREFFSAFISEVDFPAMDAAAKEPARLRVVLEPEYTRLSTAGIGRNVQTGSFCKSPLLLTSNFQFAVDSINTSKVRAVEPLSVKIVISEGAVGDERDYQQNPGKISFPNVLVTVPQVALQGFNEWFEDFVIAGNNSDESERSGSLQLLTPNLSQAPIRLDFMNMGIFEIEPQSPQASDSTGASVVKMYVERMELTYSGACGGPQ